jgi:hypothetical protein
MEHKVTMLLIPCNFWNVVDKNEQNLGRTDLTTQLVWKSMDSKAHVKILLHCGGKTLISLRSFFTSKVVQVILKQIYQCSNKISQMNLHKRMCHLTMLNSNDVGFLESW